MTVFGDELFRRTPFKFWTLAPALVLGMSVILMPGGPWDEEHVGAVILCEAAGVLLLFSLWPYHRLPFVRRALAGLVAATYLVYAFDALWPQVFDWRGSSNPVLALAGLIVIGAPCTLYALLGRFRWRPAPLAIDPDEPLLLRASDQARARIPRLFELWPDAAEAHVRFPFESQPADEEEGIEPLVEHLWGKVLTLAPRSVSVRVLTPPVYGTLEQETLELPLANVSDWEVELRDGSLEGGFTTRAMVAWAEREGQDVPVEITRRLPRYRDVAAAS